VAVEQGDENFKSERLSQLQAVHY